MNSAMVMGRLVSDPELRTLQSDKDKSVTSFCVASPRSYNHEIVDYIDCVAWDGQAKFITDYFHKGKMIAVKGDIQTRTYEDRQGKSRKITEINVKEVSFCGDKDAKKEKTSQRASETTLEAELPF